MWIKILEKHTFKKEEGIWTETSEDKHYLEFYLIRIGRCSEFTKKKILNKSFHYNQIRTTIQNIDITNC